jgi:hypothetical protein
VQAALWSVQPWQYSGYCAVLPQMLAGQLAQLE